MRDLKTFINICEEEMTNWIERLKYATFWSNNTIKAFGKSNRLVADELLGLCNDLELEQTLSDQNMDRYRTEMKQDHDKGCNPKILFLNLHHSCRLIHITDRT